MDSKRARFAAAALNLVGVPFRLHGRSREAGLDCVGLLLAAAKDADITIKVPAAYNMRCTGPDHYIRWFEQPGFHRVMQGEPLRDGDIVIVRPSRVQLHFMIRAKNSYVHAHASLRRVVHMPAPSPWPIWRSYRLAVCNTNCLLHT